ncbi:uncharacterized protein LOC131997647 [Stomoxys calcitrans]|uniref:uncharacterized protein LOC131997647 n=1 Tax=Stomoxys calcitrans TaxID=35570 RepID=UPI0027E39982|nr:uncharacterized protein LOC131997647 [Stomoxys calcitrans]
MSSKKFIFFSDQVVTFCATFANIPLQDHTISGLEVELEDLERRWRQLVQIYESEMTSENPVNTEEERVSTHSKFGTTCKAYKECKASILDLLFIEKQKQIKTQANGSEIRQDLQTVDTGYSLKVPPCDTEIFSGGYEKWPSFRDMFTAIYGRHPKLSPAQKLFHLRAKTRGEANQIVKGFALTDLNYELAWKALKERYENKRILINHQLRKIFDLEMVSTEKSKSLRNLQYTINNCLSVLKSYNISVIAWDPILVFWVSSKLPQETLSAWEGSIQNHKDMTTWNQLNEFLSNRLDLLESISDIRRPGTNTGTTSQKSQSYMVKSDATPRACRVCQKNHALRQCSKFISMSLTEKREFIAQHKICENCLSYGHKVTDCRIKKLCQECNQTHHTLLHSRPDRNEPQNPSSYHIATQEEEEPSSFHPPMDEVQMNFSESGHGTILPTALIDLEHLGNRFTIRAFLDQGSQETFIANRIVSQLGIPTSKSFTKISGLGGTVLETSSRVCNLKLRSRRSSFVLETMAIVISNLNHLMPSATHQIDDWTGLNQLELADPFFYKTAKIDMLIGSDILPCVLKTGVHRNISENLLAQESEFGWFISGPQNSRCVTTFAAWASHCTTSLNDAVRKFWESEEIPEEIQQSEEDLECEQIYKDTTQRQDNGRYIVRLPFKKEFPQQMSLGSSRRTALGQFFRMEKTLKNSPALSEEYNRVLQEYLVLDHMTAVSADELCNGKSYMSFYLPHHAVVKPERTSTKLRVVFNASKKTTSGFSLNDVLYTGPTLQNDLMNVILRWRLFQYVFNGDIQKMYRQILVDERDQQYQRCIFKKTLTDPVQDFALKTVTFGVNCAPYLAIRTLLQLSTDGKKTHPAASDILRRDIYVDDVLSGGHSINEAKGHLTELVDLLASAGFPLKKITANHADILQTVPAEDLLDQDFLKLEDSSDTKTLGIRWNAMMDVFYYNVYDINNLKETITKRTILSIVAKLFDPAGWLTPIIITAKMLLQQLWIDGTDWDEKVKPHSLEKWFAFLGNFSKIPEIRIPRWIGYRPQKVIQIHGFCDASEKAYCACLYIRVVEAEDRISCQLLVSKSKVAPLKTISLPRLELCGAVLLARLTRSTCEHLNFKQRDIYLWSDSTITLAWLSKPPYQWKTYVANRVSRILDHVGNANWLHVNSGDNPADLGTRGCTTTELKENKLWWNGPKWLKGQISDWPQQPILTQHSLEKKTNAFHTLTEQEDILDRFSSYHRALRVLAYMFRFIRNCRRQIGYISPNGLITSEELNFVKYRAIIISQRAYFHREYDSLMLNSTINVKSRLLTLNPYLDKNGLLRVNGRLSNSDLSFNEKHPIILPEKSKLCKLLVDFTHQILMHAEHQTMLRSIRQEFYVIRLRNVIRQCIRTCKICTIYKHRIRSQIMAALPQERCIYSPPFTNTGVDFAGPFEIKTSKLRNAKLEKGYAVVFVCLSTRAIHLEACSSLSSEAFLATFDRFVGRRGFPVKVFSDNGTNFVGANRILANEYKNFLKLAEKALVEKYSIHGFSWHFIPPQAPHMGGLWEAGVKSMKAHLRKVAGNLKFTYEEFSTLLIRIESILNSRPLSPISETPSELVALTPGHFLKGSPLVAVPEEYSDNMSLISRWQRLKVLQLHFAKRWKNEYISELQRRYKWKTLQKDLKEDDLVVIKDDNLPPTEWRLGRVTRVFTGNDSKVRVADVRTQNGIMTRPLVKLCILPISQQRQITPTQ